MRECKKKGRFTGNLIRYFSFTASYFVLTISITFDKNFSILRQK